MNMFVNDFILSACVKTTEMFKYLWKDFNNFR